MGEFCKRNWGNSKNWVSYKKRKVICGDRVFNINYHVLGLPRKIVTLPVQSISTGNNGYRNRHTDSRNANRARVQSLDIIEIDDSDEEVNNNRNESTGNNNFNINPQNERNDLINVNRIELSDIPLPSGEAPTENIYNSNLSRNNDTENRVSASDAAVVETTKRDIHSEDIDSDNPMSDSHSEHVDSDCPMSDVHSENLDDVPMGTNLNVNTPNENNPKSNNMEVPKDKIEIPCKIEVQTSDNITQNFEIHTTNIDAGNMAKDNSLNNNCAEDIDSDYASNDNCEPMDVSYYEEIQAKPEKTKEGFNSHNTAGSDTSQTEAQAKNNENNNAKQNDGNNDINYVNNNGKHNDGNNSKNNDINNVNNNAKNNDNNNADNEITDCANNNVDGHSEGGSFCTCSTCCTRDENSNSLNNIEETTDSNEENTESCDENSEYGDVSINNQRYNANSSVIVRNRAYGDQMIGGCDERPEVRNPNVVDDTENLTIDGCIYHRNENNFNWISALAHISLLGLLAVIYYCLIGWARHHREYLLR